MCYYRCYWLVICRHIFVIIMIPTPETQWPHLLRRIPFVCIISMMLSLISTSCSNNEQQAKKENTIEDDSVQTVKSIVSEDSVMVFRNNASNWIGESIQKTGLDWSRFHLTEFWSDDSLEEKYFEPSAGFYKDYEEVLRW